MTEKKKRPSLKQAGESGMPANYAMALAEIKERVRRAQYAALKSVNKQLVGLYWDIGRIIVERQAAEGWGRSVVETLAGDLQREFPGVSGFSAQNLWYMRQFYAEYHDNEKLRPLVGEIAWTHNLVIMSKCKDSLEREFYLLMTHKFGWSKEEGENPSIGIILCKEKNRTIVEYALMPTDKPIGVATYQIVKQLPKALRGQLPSPEQIARILEDGA